MNQLIAMNAEVTMSSREIADLVEARHNDVVSTIDRLFDKGLLRSSRKTRREATGGRPIEVYDLNERDTHLVVAGYSDEHRAKVIDRWQELETKAKPSFMCSLSPEAIIMLEDLDRQLRKSQQQLAIAAPKAAIVDRVMDRTNLLNATQVGQQVGLSAVKLNRNLDQIGGVYSKSVKRGRVFTQPWLDSGFGEMKQTEQGYPQALFTTKGAIRVVELLTSEGVV